MSCVPAPGDREARVMWRLCLLGRDVAFRNEKLRVLGAGSPAQTVPFPALDLQGFRN